MSTLASQERIAMPIGLMAGGARIRKRPVDMRYDLTMLPESDVEARYRALSLIRGIGLLFTYLGIGAHSDVPLQGWVAWLAVCTACGALVAHRTCIQSGSRTFLVFPTVTWCVFRLIDRAGNNRTRLTDLFVSLRSFLFLIGIGVGLVAITRRVLKAIVIVIECPLGLNRTTSRFACEP